MTLSSITAMKGVAYDQDALLELQGRREVVTEREGKLKDGGGSRRQAIEINGA